MCITSLSGVQERSSDPLELELQMVVNQFMGAGTQTQVLCKSNTCSKP